MAVSLGSEANIVVNGITLTTAEAMTVRVALGIFSIHLEEGVREDTNSDAIVAGYKGCIKRIHRIFHG